MNSQQIIELIANGEFDAILMCLSEVQTFVGTLATSITAMQTEVNDAIQSPARLDPLTQVSKEKFVGTYFVGDQLEPTEVQGQSNTASVQVGPTSEIILNYMPTKANHAIPKVYVDNLFRPINKTLLAIQAAVAKKVVMAYYFNTGSNQVMLQETDLQPGSSSNCQQYFSANPNTTSNQLTFLQQGSYLLLIYITATVNNPASDNEFMLSLNGKLYGQTSINSGSAPMFLPMSVNALDVITWQVSGSLSGVSFGMSIVRLGDQ
jgi:hypothetical protein